jgi:hypothetical protein
MTQYGSDDGSFKVGANVMTTYIDSDIEVEKTAETEEVTPLGASVTKEAFTGITSLKDIGVGGVYDDTASTGPDAVFGAIGTSAAVEVGYGGTKKTTATLGMKTYKRTISKGKLTRYASTLCHTGTAITEA